MYIYVGLMDRSIIISLQHLHTLRVSSVWIYQLHGFRIRSLDIRQPHCEDKQEPQSICLMFHGKSPKHYPHANRLTNITLCGETEGQITETSSMSMSNKVRMFYLSERILLKNLQFWLAPFASTIRRLNLYGVHTGYNVKDLTFPRLEIIESHWCSPGILHGGHYPSLKKYSESIELEGCNQQMICAIKDCLHQIDTLAIRVGLSGRFQEDRSKDFVDLQQILPDLSSAQASGCLRSCLVDGPFNNVPTERAPWLFLLCAVGPEEKRSTKRHKMLKTIDPAGDFWETQDFMPQAHHWWLSERERC